MEPTEPWRGLWSAFRSQWEEEVAATLVYDFGKWFGTLLAGHYPKNPLWTRLSLGIRNVPTEYSNWINQQPKPPTSHWNSPPPTQAQHHVGFDWFWGFKACLCQDDVFSQAVMGAAVVHHGRCPSAYHRQVRCVFTLWGPHRGQEEDGGGRAWACVATCSSTSPTIIPLILPLHTVAGQTETPNRQCGQGGLFRGEEGRWHVL